MGRSRTVISTSSGSRPSSAQCRRRISILAWQPRPVRRHVAGVGLLGDNPQGAPFAAATDDDRHLAHRPRVAGRLGQVHRATVVGLGAGRPQCAQGLDAHLQLVQPRRGVREVQSVRLVLAQPPTGPQPAEGPAAAQRVERGHGLGQMPGAPEGHRGDQGAQPQPGVQSGQQSEGDVGLWDRLPGPVDLWDLDQVVHQGQAGEAESSAARARSTSQPVGSSPHGKRETCRIT